MFIHYISGRSKRGGTTCVQAVWRIKLSRLKAHLILCQINYLKILYMLCSLVNILIKESYVSVKRVTEIIIVCTAELHFHG